MVLNNQTPPTTVPNGWIDATLPLISGMTTWPGDPALRTERVVSMDDGEVCNVTRLEMCVHTGTHMDAPRHFLADGATMDQAPLEVLMGPARVIAIDHPRAVTVEELIPHDLQRGERILLKTATPVPQPMAPFNEQFVYVSNDAARHIAQCGIALLGINSPSVGGFRNDLVETHVTLLSAGIWVVENLDLTHAPPGHYEILCLPLKVVGSDGAPARVLLRPV